jgi:hypothetical protein
MIIDIRANAVGSTMQTHRIITTARSMALFFLFLLFEKLNTFITSRQDTRMSAPVPKTHHRI